MGKMLRLVRYHAPAHSARYDHLDYTAYRPPINSFP